MKYYKLANGVEVPAIGFGTWQAPAGKTAVDSVLCALECGYTSIDTATAYNNEESVGEGICKSGISRSELFITTKLWNADQGYDSTLRAFDASMKKLRLDYLDLYLIHWPGRDKYVPSWKAMAKLYSEKRIRAIGVSNFLVHHLNTLIKDADVVPLVNQIELQPYLAQAATEAYCKGKNILVEAWSPLMSGGEALRDPVIAKIAEKNSKTPAQVILRWHYQLGRRILPKSVTPSRIKENIDIFDFALDDEEMKSINRLSAKNQRTGPHPDTFFMDF